MTSDRTDHLPISQTPGAIAEFYSNITQLLDSFSALRREHGPEQATFDLIAVIKPEDRNWAHVHLAVAIATLDEAITPPAG
ncbi:hypothetical protein [Amycolatopsis sp. NPDC059021]|uniref:hypothetical protein n=1 Tax=Amycolatopsis sp. NPDC059021 TaxID=3346704 RepID=UPI00366BE7F1